MTERDKALLQRVQELEVEIAWKEALDGAWLAGMAARLDGKPEDTNPYPAEDPGRHDAWDGGWADQSEVLDLKAENERLRGANTNNLEGWRQNVAGLQSQIARLERVNEQLREVLAYWLPPQEPMAFAVDEARLGHRRKWAEARDLLRGEEER